MLQMDCHATMSTILDSSNKSTDIFKRSFTFPCAFEKSSFVLYSPSSSNRLCNVVAETGVFLTSTFAAAMPRPEAWNERSDVV